MFELVDVYNVVKDLSPAALLAVIVFWMVRSRDQGDKRNSTLLSQTLTLFGKLSENIEAQTGKLLGIQTCLDDAVEQSSQQHEKLGTTLEGIRSVLDTLPATSAAKVKEELGPDLAEIKTVLQVVRGAITDTLNKLDQLTK